MKIRASGGVFYKLPETVQVELKEKLAKIVPTGRASERSEP